MSGALLPRIQARDRVSARHHRDDVGPPQRSVRVLIAIPTYNERDNIATAIAAVVAACPTAHVLVVDDGSPDGTGAIADTIAAGDPRVFVLHRTAKAGLGAAYLAGFAWALEAGYDVVGEFDADGSHPAAALPSMLGAIDAGADLVIGSRWVDGGSVVDWPRSRELLSRGGNNYARAMLRLPIRDATGGFRLFRAATLEALDLCSVVSKGYCFQIDLTVRAHDAGARIVEIPIEFRERTHGTSKMSRTIVLEAMCSVTIWGLQRAFGGGRRVRASSLASRAG